MKLRATIKKETEKALLLEVFASYKNKGTSVDLWMPKSQVKQENENSFEIAEWFLKSKKEELASRVQGLAKRVKFVSEVVNKKPIWI